MLLEAGVLIGAPVFFSWYNPRVLARGPVNLAELGPFFFARGSYGGRRGVGDEWAAPPVARALLLRAPLHDA